MIRGMMVKPYDHQSLTEILDVIGIQELFPLLSTTYLPRYQRVLGQLRALQKEMENKVYQFVDADPESVAQRKMFGFYVLAVGLAIRFTKVSSEVFGWKSPAPTPSKYPRGAQNSLWREGS